MTIKMELNFPRSKHSDARQVCSKNLLFVALNIVHYPTQLIGVIQENKIEKNAPFFTP